jgi:hypothetical protein
VEILAVVVVCVIISVIIKSLRSPVKTTETKARCDGFFHSYSNDFVGTQGPWDCTCDNDADCGGGGDCGGGDCGGGGD